MGEVSISKHEHKNIPWEIILQDRSVSTNNDNVLQVWKSAFQQLLNTSEADSVSDIHIDMHRSILDTTSLNNQITIQALLCTKQGKALRDDGIPGEVLHSNACFSYLVRLFNSCFQSASVPDA